MTYASEYYKLENIENKYWQFRKLFVPIETLKSFSYVRETTYTTNHRMSLKKRDTIKRPIWGEQHNGIIGYVCVGKTWGYYDNIVWWHKHHDRDVNPNDCYKFGEPSEAVTPSRVIEFFPEYW